MLTEMHTFSSCKFVLQTQNIQKFQMHYTDTQQTHNKFIEKFRYG